MQKVATLLRGPSNGSRWHLLITNKYPQNLRDEVSWTGEYHEKTVS